MCLAHLAHHVYGLCLDAACARLCKRSRHVCSSACRRLDYFNRILRSLKYSMKDCFEDTSKALAGAGDKVDGGAGGGDDDDESTVLGDVDIDGMTVRRDLYWRYSGVLRVLLRVAELRRRFLYVCLCRFAGVPLSSLSLSPSLFLSFHTHTLSLSSLSADRLTSWPCFRFVAA